MLVTDEYLLIGVIVSVYGIKGWVKIKSFTEPISNFSQYTQCFLNPLSGDIQTIEFEEIKIHGKVLVAKIADIDDRNDAEALCKTEIWVNKDALMALPDEDYYWYQLEGLAVYCGEQLLGKVSHLMETGSNDVLVIKACDGSIDKRERLLPYRPEVVTRIDLPTKTMSVEWDVDF